MSSTFPTSHDIERAASALDSQVDRMADTAHRVVDDLASKTAPAAERVRTSMHHAMDTMHRRMDDLAETRDEWMETTRESIREHPLTMVCGAIAIGFLLAKLSRHS